ncbi:MAG: Holliday junction resolvase RuvX [Phycisphaerales bacterium]
MRFLAVDLGDKRTGLAVGDDETNLASPLTVIEVARGDALIDAIADSIKDHAPDAIVLGLPLNMDGTEGSQAKLVREFGEHLHDRCGLEVHYHDERLTSFAADQQMARSGRTHKQKKRLRDALAATEILRDFLDGRA